MTTAHVIAIVQLPPPVNGLSSVNARMVAELRQRGTLKTVVDVAPPAGAGGLRKQCARLARTVAAASILVRGRRDGATTLYMPSDGGAGMIWNIALVAVARLLGYRVWVHHHSFAYIARRSVLMWLQLALAPRGTRHIALCATMLAGLERRYARVWSRRGHAGRVLGNAFMADPAKATARRTGPLTIGHLSNLTVAKGSIRFIRLFRAARAEGLDVVARIAGPIGDEPTRGAIEAAVRDHGDGFRWLGPLYGQAKTDFYRSLDAFVFPTRYVNEAQPLVLLEALAGGAAVLSTNPGCIGCDHSASPGVATPDAAFDEAMMSWLRRHVDPGARAAIPASASRALAEARTLARSQLRLTLSEI